jgi:endo-alpha-1,4-polygalactosaminidase (GH114 family)
MAVLCMDFENMLDAGKALTKLKEMGYKKAYLDMVDKFHEEYSEEISVVGNAATRLLVNVEPDQYNEIKNLLKSYQ